MPYTFNPFTGSFDNTPTVPEVEGVYVPLSGGTITGNFEISGGGEATLYVEGTVVGINTETPNEALTVVGNISSDSIVYADDIFASGDSIRLTNLPTASGSLPSGTLWVDQTAGYVLKVVP